MTLPEFITEHTLVEPATQGKLFDKEAQRIGLIFFDVHVKGTPDAEQFRSLIAKHHGEFCEVNLFDGEEHSYIEVGGWIGDQELALRFMGLGALLGLWQLLTPYSVLPASLVTPEMASMLAGRGLITVAPCRKS